jgi:hypothetical protein
MRILYHFLAAFICIATGISCQRELNFDDNSIGRLKKNTAGNCLPVSTAGVFKADSLFTENNYAEVQVDVSFPGKFDIRTDTVNGFFFQQSGKVNKGISTIRLQAKGKPLQEGVANFTARYGESSCRFSVTVKGAGPAIFTLSGAPGGCLAGFADGTYIQGMPLTATHTLTVDAVVTGTGTYTIKTIPVNGMSFTGSGIFYTTGTQPVVLTGTGTPVKAETTPITILHNPGNCTLPVVVNPQGFGEAQFSFEGTPGSCINPDVKGAYYAGIAANSANTVTLRVNVTRAGTYAIQTNLANGLVFDGSGVFVGTGLQTVTLTASGTPFRVESTAFIPNTGTASCNFFADILPLPPPAVFTLGGAPGNCAPVTVNGFYIVSKPLDAANTVLIKADVTTPGSYTVTTNTANGFSFAASGVFSATGTQNIILRGTGTPQALTTAAFTPRYGASLCNFTVTVQ